MMQRLNLHVRRARSVEIPGSGGVLEFPAQLRQPAGADVAVVGAPGVRRPREIRPVGARRPRSLRVFRGIDKVANLPFAL